MRVLQVSLTLYVGPLKGSVVRLSPLAFRVAMASAGDSPRWAVNPVVELTPAEVYANWSGEFAPPHLPGQPPPVPRDAAAIPPRESALARALLQTLRLQSRADGYLIALRDISNGRIAELQEELDEARAAAAGAARGAELAAALERDRRPPHGLPCRFPEPEAEPDGVVPEPEPEGVVMAVPASAPSDAVRRAVHSGRLGDLADAMAVDGVGRRVRPRTGN